MSSVLDAFICELKARIADAKQDRLNQIAGGMCEDYAAYKHAVGAIETFDNLGAAIDDIKAKVTGG